MARPIKSRPVVEGSVPNGLDRLVANKNEAEIGGGLTWPLGRLPGPPVVGDPFETPKHPKRSKPFLSNEEKANRADGASQNGGGDKRCELPFQRNFLKQNPEQPLGRSGSKLRLG